MKRIFSTLLGIGCVASMFLSAAEKSDGSCDIIWSLSFLAIAAICGLAYTKINSQVNLRNDA